jgi:hypothetical protein
MVLIIRGYGKHHQACPNHASDQNTGVLASAAAERANSEYSTLPIVMLPIVMD